MRKWTHHRTASETAYTPDQNGEATRKSGFSTSLLSGPTDALDDGQPHLRGSRAARLWETWVSREARLDEVARRVPAGRSRLKLAVAGRSGLRVRPFLRGLRASRGPGVSRQDMYGRRPSSVAGFRGSSSSSSRSRGRRESVWSRPESSGRQKSINWRPDRAELTGLVVSTSSTSTSCSPWVLLWCRSSSGLLQPA